MTETIKRFQDIHDIINEIIQSCTDYGLEEVVDCINIDYNTEIEKIGYTFSYPSAKFPCNNNFQMKLKEKAISNMSNLNLTEVSSFSYHGFHKDQNSDPQIDFIRFDFEPFKQKYSPLHINVNKKKWGDHLTFPDETNLDISKMKCRLALKVFSKYAIDKNNNPIDQSNNQEYAELFDKEEY